MFVIQMLKCQHNTKQEEAREAQSSAKGTSVQIWIRTPDLDDFRYLTEISLSKDTCGETFSRKFDL